MNDGEKKREEGRERMEAQCKVDRAESRTSRLFIPFDAKQTPDQPLPGRVGHRSVCHVTAPSAAEAIAPNSDCGETWRSPYSEGNGEQALTVNGNPE